MQQKLKVTEQNEMVHGPCAHLGLHDKKYFIVDTESEYPVLSNSLFKATLYSIQPSACARRH
jgi:hypothetical protein